MYIGVKSRFSIGYAQMSYWRKLRKQEINLEDGEKYKSKKENENSKQSKERQKGGR